MVGETPIELHRRLRLERAAHQLVRTDAPITRIAFAAGYSSHEAFTRAFGEAFGVSPREWRRRGAVAGTVTARALRVFVGEDGMVHIPTRLMTEGASPMDVQIMTMPTIRVASLTYVGPYDAIGETFGRVGALAGRAGLFAHPDARMIAIYLDDPESTPPEELRSAAGVVIPDGVSVPDGLEEIALPAGRYACVTHVGPYTGLGQAWAEFMGQWLPDSGHTLALGECYETYLNSPTDTPSDELRTELYMPLA